MKINNLTVKKNEKIILNNLNLTLEEGKTHIIMGPNGSGKTTLSYTLAGHPDCFVANGNIEYKNKNLLELSIEERSLNGIYLAPQYPVVIEGLSHAAVLKESINIKRKFLNLNEIDEFDFLKLLKQKAQEYKFDPKDYIRHSFNSGYSGGVFLLAGLKEYAHSVHIHHSVAGRYVCLPGGCGIQSEYPDIVCTGACHWYGGGRCHCGGGSGAVQI